MIQNLLLGASNPLSVDYYSNFTMHCNCWFPPPFSLPAPRPTTSKALESRDFRLFPTFFSQPSAWYTQMFPGGRKGRGERGETLYPNLFYGVKYKTLRRSNFSSFSVPIVSSLTHCQNLLKVNAEIFFLPHFQEL